MLGSPILYLKGMRLMMFQLSGFYCRGMMSLGSFGFRALGSRRSRVRISGLGVWGSRKLRFRSLRFTGL